MRQFAKRLFAENRSKFGVPENIAGKLRGLGIPPSTAREDETESAREDAM